MPTRVKEAVIDIIQRMPDDASVADIMAERYLRKKVDEGLSAGKEASEQQGSEIANRVADRRQSSCDVKPRSSAER